MAEEESNEVDEEPHEARAAKLLDDKIRNALDYIGTEFQVTTSLAIGVLMGQVHRLLHECQDEDEDEEDEEENE